MVSRVALWIGAVGIVGSSLVFACRSDPARADALVCERAYSVCPNVQPASSSDITDCARQLDGPCGTTMRQYIRCVAGKCDDAGDVDLGATESSCGFVLDAYRACTQTDAGDASARPEPELEPDPVFPVDGGSSDAAAS